jgi:molybdopterin-guanine dinucleotide biosynthesis protein A
MFAEPGQGDKALLDLCGKPMLAHVADALAAQTARVIVSANGDPERFSQFGLPIVADTVPDHAGPLAGLLAGMVWAAGHAPETRYLASVPADAPFIPADLVSRLLAAVAGKPNAIAIAASQGTVHHVVGLWPLTLANDIEAALLAGQRQVSAFAARHGAEIVAFDTETRGARRVDPFLNANTPSEFEEARAILAS